MPVLVLDNGASTIKVGLSSDDENSPPKSVCFSHSIGDTSEPNFRIVVNAAIRSKGDRKMYIGPEFEKCQDHFGLHYRLPFERA